MITGEASRPSQDSTYYLLAAYWLLQAMPQSGLEEACQALNEVFEYHLHRSLKVLPRPAEPRVKAKLKPIIKQDSFRIEAE